MTPIVSIPPASVSRCGRPWPAAQPTPPSGTKLNVSDGQRFALTAVPETQTTARHDKVVFIFNFFEELRRIAPVKK